MSVLLIPNPTKDTGLAVTRQAAAVLAGLGVFTIYWLWV